MRTEPSQPADTSRCGCMVRSLESRVAVFFSREQVSELEREQSGWGEGQGNALRSWERRSSSRGVSGSKCGCVFVRRVELKKNEKLKLVRNEKWDGRCVLREIQLCHTGK